VLLGTFSFVPEPVLVLPLRLLTIKTTRNRLLLSIPILSATMEQALFVPCTRMYDLMCALIHEPGHRHLFQHDMHFERTPSVQGFREVDLRAGVGIGAVDSLLRRTDFTFSFNDLWELANRKIVWFGPNIFFKAKGKVVGVSAVCQSNGFGSPIFSLGLPDNTGGDNELEVYCRSGTNSISTCCIDVFQLMTSALFYSCMYIGSFNGGEDTTLSLPVMHATTTATDNAISTVCIFVFQWMTRSNTDWAHWEFNVSTRVLSEFLQISRDTSGGNIRFGRQHDLSADSEAYLLLFEGDIGTHHRLELQFGKRVENWSELRIEAVVTFLQSCQCTLILRFGEFPVPTLIRDTLSGKSRIVDIILDQVPNIGELVLALRSNKSLLRLAFSNIPINDENWTTLCQSLASHSTLVHLRLRGTLPHEFEPADTPTEMKVRRTDAFLLMLQTNTALRELDARDEFDGRTLSHVILPYLRVSTFARTDPSLGLFARALSIVLKEFDNFQLTWMLIHSNVPTILGSRQGNEQEAVVPNA
jgi:hypothetical protein